MSQRAPVLGRIGWFGVAVATMGLHMLSCDRCMADDPVPCTVTVSVGAATPSKLNVGEKTTVPFTASFVRGKDASGQECTIESIAWNVSASAPGATCSVTTSSGQGESVSGTVTVTPTTEGKSTVTVTATAYYTSQNCGGCGDATGRGNGGAFEAYDWVYFNYWRNAPDQEFGVHIRDMQDPSHPVTMDIQDQYNVIVKPGDMDSHIRRADIADLSKQIPDALTGPYSYVYSCTVPLTYIAPGANVVTVGPSPDSTIAVFTPSAATAWPGGHTASVKVTMADLAPNPAVTGVPDTGTWNDGRECEATGIIVSKAANCPTGITWTLEAVGDSRNYTGTCTPVTNEQGVVIDYSHTNISENLGDVVPQGVTLDMFDPAFVATQVALGTPRTVAGLWQAACPIKASQSTWYGPTLVDTYSGGPLNVAAFTPAALAAGISYTQTQTYSCKTAVIPGQSYTLTTVYRRINGVLHVVTTR